MRKLKERLFLKRRGMFREVLGIERDLGEEEAGYHGEFFVLENGCRVSTTEWENAYTEEEYKAEVEEFQRNMEAAERELENERGQRSEDKDSGSGLGASNGIDD